MSKEGAKRDGTGDFEGKQTASKQQKLQVDAHVQEFLKAVLEHAHSSSQARKKSKCDASTQTDEFLSDGVVYGSPTGVYSTNGVQSDKFCAAVVPNRLMYSEEALNYAHNDHLYVTDRQLHQQCWPAEYGKCATTTDSDFYPVFSDVNQYEASQSAVAEWAQQYEQWFIQNFGVDVRQTLPDLPSVSKPVEETAEVSQDVGPQNQPQIVTSISASPVRYIVPEGSLCAPSNEFPAYVSLVPTFYTSEAFQHANTHFYHPSLITQPAAVYGTTPLAFSQPASTVNGWMGSQHIPPQQPLPVVPDQIPLTKNDISSEDSSKKSSFDTDLTSKMFSDLPSELQTSAVFAAFKVPMNIEDGSDQGWGPLLRYGAYGRLPSAPELKALGAEPEASEDPKMPPPPPTFILLRRQAMICALQLSCRERGRELFMRESEAKLAESIDYATELDNLVRKSVGLDPLFLFTQLNKLSPSERIFYTLRDKEAPRSAAKVPAEDRLLDATEMYVCDLLIGDVFVTGACSTHKSRARICAARQAFRLLSKPCFVVGSLRSWERVEYLCLCLSPKAEVVPVLPPFLSDPFEPLSRKDRFNGQLKDEYSEIVSSKPVGDLWIYLAGFSAASLDDEVSHVWRITIGATLDGHRCCSTEANSVIEAQRVTALDLLANLRKTQPIVGLKRELCGGARPRELRYILWGVSERVLTDSLMWGREELDTAVRLEHLEAHCEILPFKKALTSDASSTSKASKQLDESSNTSCSSFHELLHSSDGLDHVIQCYAASALVTPVHIAPSVVNPDLWCAVRKSAENWGLLCRVEESSAGSSRWVWSRSKSSYLILCKRIPLSRIKRALMDEGSFGCFDLVSSGDLPSGAQKRPTSLEPSTTDDTTSEAPPGPFNPRSPSSVSPRNDDHYSDEPVMSLARRFCATQPIVDVKAEPKCAILPQPDDCVLVSAELNQPSNAIEILDDLPKTLIPGIDF